MVKAKWVVLAGLMTAAWAQAQEPMLVPAAKNSTVLRTWHTSDGRKIYEFKDLVTGDHLTVVEGDTAQASSCSHDQIVPAGEPIKPVSSTTLTPMPSTTSMPTPMVISSSSTGTPMIMGRQSPKKRSLFGRRRTSQPMPETIVLPPGSATPTFTEPIIIPAGNSTPMPASKRRSIWSREPKPEVITLPASSPPPPEAAK